MLDDNSDLYAILEVSKSATDAEIKKSFRKLAIKYHPDRNPSADAQERFQDINEANQVLSDPEKRRIYDQYGMKGLREGPGGAGGASLFDILSGNMGGRGQQRRGPKRADNVDQRLNCTLEDVYTGRQRRMRVSHSIQCNKCRGTGTKSGRPATCPDCDGQGAVMRMIRSGNMIQQFQQPCQRCRGTGRAADPKDTCDGCQGRCVVNESEAITLDIEPGMATGDRITCYGKGDAAPGYEAGDLVFHVQVEEHKIFKRKGADLLIEQHVPLSDALMGASFDIKHLDGHHLHVTLPPQTMVKENTIIRVPDQGMRVRRSGDYGSLYILVKIDMPTNIPAEQLRAAAQCLGYNVRDHESRHAFANSSENAYVAQGEVCSSEQFGQTAASASRDNAYDEDEAGHGGMHAQQVACNVI